MPTKTLPAAPSLEHLKYQAKDLIQARRSGDPAVAQRIREFHPRFKSASDDEIRDAKFSLSDAQLAIAREYGYPSWARIKTVIEGPKPQDRSVPMHERIEDPLFRRAVDLLDSGDEEGLRTHLAEHPPISHQRVTFEGGNYFRNPTLLEFCAENPIRHHSLPANIVSIAKIILEAGAKDDKPAIDSTLGLVCSGLVPRECGVQIPLIDLLCDYGGNPNSAVGSAVGQGEFEAAHALVRRGAKIDLPLAAALGQVDTARSLLGGSPPEKRHLAFAYATMFGRIEIVRMLLDAGEDPSRYNPQGAHSHSTPLHQAALAGHLDVVRLLVKHGANKEIKDILFGGTPLGWAEHSNQTAVAEYLRSGDGG